MKRPKSVPPARPVSKTPALWRNLAIIFGLSTIALAVLLVRVSNAFDQLAATQKARPTGDPAASLPRELRPYAALGTHMAENNRIADLGWSAPQFDAFLDGMRSSYSGRGVPLDDDARRLRDETSARVRKMLAQENPDPVETYFNTLRATEGVTRTDSGLHYRITEPGEGDLARPEDTVVFTVTVRLPDGTFVPEMNLVRSRSAVRDLLPGLAEGIQLLPVGAKALLYLPPKLAFGAHPPASVPAGSPIICFVELHDIIPPEQ
ncbi:MAG: FKBP-type peptidyl-prolyl cis-trans isomerase [Opitutaceae bacterium]|nr:FKBP-type peptidyl-prolyl cis-trans isomerase [Opitutaceae bacterium]